ncbi:outer membrane beta-barrel protein [Pararcticibacter amylolyticus]|nr:outer membrane beta-barrel protein [Pararcticibacter amylolyticus]
MGNVRDSLTRKALEFATVSVIRASDSTLVSYTLSDEDGNYTLRNMPLQQSLRLVISYVSYHPFRKTLLLRQGGEIKLDTAFLAGTTLKEAVVTATYQPVAVRKDTVEFNALAFKTRPSALIEELLKKIPGVDIDNAGTITVNGKKVSRILIDGKEFFGNDPTMATRNLEASLLSKIQVYDDRKNDPDHRIEESKVSKVLDLRLKKAIRRSVFGRLSASAGSRERVETGGMVNLFTDTIQFSAIASHSNLGNPGASLFSSSGPGDMVMQGGGQPSRNRVSSTGVNFNYSPKKKLMLNGVYRLSSSSSETNNRSLTSQVLNDTTLLSLVSGTGKQKNLQHMLNGGLDWQPDTLTTLYWSASANFGSNRSDNLSSNTTSNNFNPLISESQNNGTSKGDQNSFSHTLNFHRRMRKKGASYGVTQQISISPNNSRSYNTNSLLSYSSQVSSDTLRRLNDNSSKSINGNLGLSFRYPLWKKLVAGVAADASYNKSSQKSSIFNFDPQSGTYSEFIPDQSSDIDRIQWEQNVRPELVYSFNEKASLTLGLTTQWSCIDNHFADRSQDLNQEYFNFLPSFRLSLERYSFSYDASVSQPNVNDLRPVTIELTPQSSFTGNPNLKPSRSHSFTASLFSYNTEKQQYINVFVNASIQQNVIFQRKTVSGTGSESTMPENRNGQYGLSTSAELSRQFKKSGEFQFTTATSAGLMYNKNFFVVNLDEGYLNSYSLNLSQRFSMSWKDKMEFSPSYTARPVFNSYQDVAYSNIKYVYHNADARLSIRVPAKMTWEVFYSYSYNPLAGEGFQKSVHFVNAAVGTRMFKKDMAEIRLSCYDLLNQNVGSMRRVYGNTTTDIQTEILKRYFLVTCIFKFNKTAG